MYIHISLRKRISEHYMLIYLSWKTCNTICVFRCTIYDGTKIRVTIHTHNSNFLLSLISVLTINANHLNVSYSRKTLIDRLNITFRTFLHQNRVEWHSLYIYTNGNFYVIVEESLRKKDKNYVLILLPWQYIILVRSLNKKRIKHLIHPCRMYIAACLYFLCFIKSKSNKY